MDFQTQPINFRFGGLSELADPGNFTSSNATMKGNTGGHGGSPKQLTAESVPLFQEGIYLILSRWSALQLAVEEESGGPQSRQLAEQLGSHIFFWFTQSKEPLYIDDLEDILEEDMLSLNTEVMDGSVEEVAEKLMIMHEECLEGDYNSIEKLRQAAPRTGGHQHVRQGTDDDDGEDDDDDDDLDHRGDNRSNMIVDAPQFHSSPNEPNMEVDKPQEDDGWTTVASTRKNRGKRNQNHLFNS